MADDLRVIVVDPYAMTVNERTVKKKLKSYQKIVGGPVEAYYGINQFWPKHAMFLNEEGKLQRGPHHIWKINGLEEIFCGPAMVFKVAGATEIHVGVSAYDFGQRVQFLGQFEQAPIARPRIRYISLD